MDAAEIRYTGTHEWCKIEEGSILIGVTPNALAAIGDVVYLDLPAVGEDVLKEIPFGEIEGTRGTKDLSSPLDGLVVDVNLQLAQNPDLLLKKPQEDGWLIRLKPDGPASLDNLLSSAAYEAMTKKKKRSR
jgi:glycine cleavage system H protein